jgi:ADP compounds hydrolase
VGVLFESKWFAIAIDADGMEFVRADDEVLVVALEDDGYVLLTEEPSAAFGAPTLVLPGGVAERGEELAAAANRELQEEVGFRAGVLEYLGELRPYSKYLAVRSHIYLARQLTPSTLPSDEEYEIELVRAPLHGFEEMFRDRRLLDARVIAALCLARAFAA